MTWELGHRRVLEGALLLSPSAVRTIKSINFPLISSRTGKGAAQRKNLCTPQTNCRKATSTPLSAFSNNVRKEQRRGEKGEERGRERDASAATGFHFPDHWPRITITGTGREEEEEEEGSTVRSTVTSQVLRFWLLGDGIAEWKSSDALQGVSLSFIL